MKKRKPPIQTCVERQTGLRKLPAYTVTVRGELPFDLSARVSAVHAQCILRSDSRGPSDAVQNGVPDGAAAMDLGLDWTNNRPIIRDPKAG